MSLEPMNPSLGYGGMGLIDRLPRIIAELQGQTFSLLTGAAANAAIPVADGIDLQDTIARAIMFAAGVPSDITSSVSIVDTRAFGTLTCTGVVAGDTCVVNGKTYTAIAFIVTPTNSAYGPYNFPVGTSDAITAKNLAAAIMSGDSTLTCVVVSNVITITYRQEGTAGNAVTLVVTGSNGHIARSGAVFTGGLAGYATGTVTLAAAAVGDTVTVDGVVFTAVASGTILELNQFVGGTVAVVDLTQIGFSPVVAAAIIAAGNDKAAATILAHQINANDGARVTANNGLPVSGPLEEFPGTGGAEVQYNITVTQAATATAVVTITSDADTSAAASIVLVSSSGTKEAVTGSGTLTAASRAIKSTVNTTGNTVLLIWYKKWRGVGQF